MVLHSGILSNTWWAPIHRPVVATLFRRFPVSSKQFTSFYTPEVLTEDCRDFLPWLEHKAGAEISSLLLIGNKKSSYGRTLFASKNIQFGDCLFRVPYNVQLTPENLPPEVTRLFGDGTSNVAKAALVVLQEKGFGQNSDWAPYINCLPRLEDLHNSIFWSDEELEMIETSALYKETLRQKMVIENDFWRVKPAIDQHPDRFHNVTLKGFRYAYGLVTSRAWDSSKGISLIPFADFLNHDGTSEACVLNDESKQHSEVIADRDFAPGDEVMIRYGKFSNATLLLDFGFTISHNKYDQVQIELKAPEHDTLYAQKLELLDRHRTRRVKDVNEFTSSGDSFMIKEVRKGCRKGKGIPQALRAFARIVTCNSLEELNALSIEAEYKDGRLARSPLKSRNWEIAAHQYLLSEINHSIKVHKKAIKFIAATPWYPYRERCLRMRLARDLLSGELRVLKSASLWLENYCSTSITI